MNEIDGPALVGMRYRRQHIAADVPHTALTARPWLEAELPVDPVHALVVDDQTIATEHQSDPAIAKAPPLHRDRSQPLDEFRLIASLQSILRDRSGTATDLASDTLAQSEILQRPHRRFSAGGPQEFFR